MSLQIDHATIAGTNLDQLDAIFEKLGLKTEYGGPHSNQITHMSLIGFDDGSYLELISSLQANQVDSVFWGEHIAQNGGPCAWAVYVDDIQAESERLRQLDIKVDGPHYYHRQRPDGQLVEWDLSIVGTQGAGAKLPFLIQDRTPRSLRVQPSESVRGSLLQGIRKVVLNVTDLKSASQLFQRAYGWASPQISQNSQFGATLADFETTPVILAQALNPDSWLAARLKHFGESPCAYLLVCQNFAQSQTNYQLEPAMPFGTSKVAWFNPDLLGGYILGVIDAA